MCLWLCFPATSSWFALLLYLPHTKVDRRYQQSVDKLEAELNSYKTNLIKESIRMGYNELGDLSYRR